MEVNVMANSEITKLITKKLEKDKDKRCSKCGGLMVPGFVSDNTVSFWSEKSRLISVSETSEGSTKQQNKKESMYPIITYRCSGCGYIEWYATPHLKRS